MQVINKIGKGSSGNVYKAQDKKSKEESIIDRSKLFAYHLKAYSPPANKQFSKTKFSPELCAPV
jgi:serine/threonine protein kinase